MLIEIETINTCFELQPETKAILIVMVAVFAFVIISKVIDIHIHKNRDL